MKDKDKTKQQLVNELAELRQRIAELESSETDRRQAEEALRESEERYRALFDQGLDGVMVIDENAEVLLANQTAADIMGLDSVEEFLEANILHYIAPQERERAISIIAEDMFEKDLRRVNEFRCFKKSGEEMWISAIGVLTEYKGKKAGLASFRDITDRKRAQEALRASEGMLRLTLESIAEGITISDLDGNIIQVNDAVVRMHGYNAKEELIGRNAFEFIPVRDHPRARENLEKTLKKGHSGTIEYTFVKKDRSEFAAELSVAVLSDADGNAAGLVAITRDITERKQAEEREKQLQEELLLSSRLASIGELAAGVGHEINNPLTGVIGFSQRLLRKSTDGENRRYLERINREAQRVAKIVENLLTFARRRKSKKEYTDINDVLERTLELRAYELRTSNIDLEVELAPGLPRTWVDSQHIQQVFLNLILNAEQFMTEANKGGKLSIKTREMNGRIRISFADNGPGIAAEALDKVFDPFFTTRGEKGGTGLGLSLCHGIITDHGGKIYARSKPGEGSTFFVELPMVRRTEHARVAG